MGKFLSCCYLSFHQLFVNTKTDAPFHRIAYNYSRANWESLRDHLRDVPREDILKFSASAAASE